MAAPRIGLYVRAVAGRACARYGSRDLRQLIGARRASPEEKANGAEPILWDLERVECIEESVYARHRREYDGAIRRGDLVKSSAEEHARWQQIEAERERTQSAPTEPPAADAALAETPTTNTTKTKGKTK